MAGESFKSAKSEFKKWLLNIKLDEYDYVIFDNDEINNADNSLINSNKICSKNGFLLQIPKIIEYYIQNSEFPKTLIIFPFICSGKRQEEYLANIENALIFELKKVSDNEVDKNKIREDFASMLVIESFLLLNSPFFLPCEYQARLRYKELASKSVWLKGYYEITHKIPVRRDGLSIIENYSGLKLNDNYELESYGDSVLYSLKNQGFYSTIYSYIKNDKRIYTPYLFIDNIDLNEIIEIIRIILADIRKHNSSLANQIINILNGIKRQNSFGIYSQLSDLLISQVYLNYFINSTHIKGIFNIEDVSYNYGITDFQFMLKQFATHTFSDETLSDISSHLNSKMGTQSKNSSEKDFVRNIIYGLGINEAFNREGLKSHKSNFEYRDIHLSINNFIDSIKKDDLNVLRSLLFLLELTKSNKCFLETTSIENKPVFCKRIVPTELALGIMPLELGSYYEAFFITSQFYWKDDDFDEEIRLYFTERVFANNLDEDKIKIIEDAVYFARSIMQNREIVDDMLNWKDIVNFNLEKTKLLRK